MFTTLASAANLEEPMRPNAKYTVTVIYDPACPYCRRQFQHMDADSKAYDIAFNWIPISIFDRSYNGLLSITDQILKSLNDQAREIIRGSLNNSEKYVNQPANL